MEAQDRIAGVYMTVMDRVVSSGMLGDVLIVGHSQVGRLLYGYLSGLGIRADLPQAAPGCHFCYDWGAKTMLHGWKGIDSA